MHILTINIPCFHLFVVIFIYFFKFYTCQFYWEHLTNDVFFSVWCFSMFYNLCLTNDVFFSVWSFSMFYNLYHIINLFIIKFYDKIKFAIICALIYYFYDHRIRHGIDILLHFLVILTLNRYHVYYRWAILETIKTICVFFYASSCSSLEQPRSLWR